MSHGLLIPGKKCYLRCPQYGYSYAQIEVPYNVQEDNKRITGPSQIEVPPNESVWHVSLTKYNQQTFLLNFLDIICRFRINL